MAKRKTKTKPKSAGAMAALMSFMEKNPKAKYADAAAALQKQGEKIYPIMWGRAQVLLGRVKQKKRGTGAAAQAKKKAAAGKATVRRKAAAASKGGRKRMSTHRASAGPGQASRIEIAADDLNRWEALVRHLNSGGRVLLQNEGDGWYVTTG